MAKLSVVKYNGSGWEYLGGAGFTEAYAYSISLALGSDNTPYVAFRDSENGSKLSVVKYNGSGWDYLGGASFTESYAYDISLALGSDNTPYVAFQDGENSDKLSVVKYNGSGWDYLGGAGFTESYVVYVSLALGSDNTPYVAFRDSGNGSKLSVVKYNGSDWDYLGGAGFTEGSAYGISLALGSDNTPYVAFRDSGNGNKLSVVKYNGSDWDYLGGAGFTEGYANHVSLALGSDNSPYVAFGDGGYGSKLSVVKLNENPLMQLKGTPPSENTQSYDVNISVSDGELFDYQSFKLSVKAFDKKNPKSTRVEVAKINTGLKSVVKRPPEQPDDLTSKESAPSRVMARGLGYSEVIDSFSGEAGYKENIYSFNGVGAQEYSDEDGISRTLTYRVGLDETLDIGALFDANASSEEEYDGNTITQHINAYSNGTQEITQSSVFTQRLLSLSPGSTSDYSVNGVVFEQSDLAEIISSKIFLGSDGNASAEMTFSSENRFMLKSAIDDMRYLTGEYSFLAEHEELFENYSKRCLVKADKESISFEASKTYLTHTHLRDADSTLSGSTVDVNGTAISLITPECSFRNGAKSDVEVSYDEDDKLKITLKLEDAKGVKNRFTFSDEDVTTVSIKGSSTMPDAYDETGVLEFNDNESATLEMTLDSSFQEFSFELVKE